MITIKNKTITAEKKAQAVQLLVNNGMTWQDARNAVHSLGFILLDTEIYPAETFFEDELAEVKVREKEEEQKKQEAVAKCRCAVKAERVGRFSEEHYLECVVCGKQYTLAGEKIDFPEIARAKKTLRKNHGGTIAENGDKFILVGLPLKAEGGKWKRIGIRADDNEAEAGGYFDTYELIWDSLEEATIGADGAKVNKACDKYNIFQ